MFGFKITLNETTPNIMKKLLVLIAIILCAISSFAQLPSFPNNPSGTANSSTLTTNNGAFTSLGYKLKYYPDTTTANAVPYLKFTAGVMIKVGNSVLYRNTATTQWLTLAAGIPYVDSVTVSGSSICYWKLGVSTCSSIATVIDSIININNYYNGQSCESRKLSGDVFRVGSSGMTFQNTLVVFQLNCRTYTVLPSIFTFPNAPPSTEYYVKVYADTLGNVGYIVGGTSPLEIPPLTDQGSQIELVTYLIRDGFATPVGVSGSSIYFEGGPWNLTSGGIAGTDAFYTINPFAGIYSLLIPTTVSAWSKGFYLDGDTIGVNNLTFFTFQIYLHDTLDANARISIGFRNNTSYVTTNVILRSGIYGLDGNKINQWQPIALPKNLWTFQNGTSVINGMTTIYNGTIPTVQFDNIQWQKGGGNTGGNTQTPAVDSGYVDSDTSNYVYVNKATNTILFTLPTFVKNTIYDTCFTVDTVGRFVYIGFNQYCGGSGTGGNSDSTLQQAFLKSVSASDDPVLNGQGVNALNADSLNGFSFKSMNKSEVATTEAGIRIGYYGDTATSEISLTGNADEGGAIIHMNVENSTTGHHIYINPYTIKLSNKNEADTAQVQLINPPIQGATPTDIVAFGDDGVTLKKYPYTPGVGGSSISEVIAGSGLQNDNDSTVRLADSVRTGIYSGLANKLNISDTAAMLSPYKTSYPRQAISLTTTGSSGAATYNNGTGVLNVPQYSGGGGGITKAYAPLVVNVAGDSISKRYNVLNYLPGYISGVTDCTAGIQAAIDACVAGGGGTVYFPNGIYILNGALVTSGVNPNSQLVIPYVSHSDKTRTTIKFEGETMPNILPSGLYNDSPIVAKGAIIKSNITGSGTMPSIFGGKGSGGIITYHQVEFENLFLTVRANAGGTGPTVSGINAQLWHSVMLNNMMISVDTSMYRDTLAQNEVAALITPAAGSETFSQVRNSIAIGFRYGWFVGEHTVLDNAQAWSCYASFVFQHSGFDGSHPIYAQKILSQWAVIDLLIPNSTIFGIAPGLVSFDIGLLDVEVYDGTPRWFNNTYTVSDAGNYGRGRLNYKVLVNNGAHVGNFSFLKTGGSGIQNILYSDKRVFIDGTTNTAEIPLVAGLNSILKLDAPVSLANSISFNHASVQKWALLSGVGASKLDFGLYDGKATLTRLYFDSAATVNIGGTATAATTAYMNLTSSAIGMYNAKASFASTGSLTVNSTTTNPATFKNNSGSGNMVFNLNTGSNTNANIVYQNNGANVWYMANIGTSGTNKWSLTNSDGNGNVERFVLLQGGNVGIGQATPTAVLHLKAGTATASTAPIKFTAGTQLTTPESGVLETITGNELKYSTSTTADSRGFVQLGRILSTATGLTADATHNTIVLTATGQTVTLPTAVGIQGRVYTVKLTASGTGTVATTSSQTIDGSTTYSLSAQYKYVTVQSDNANWQIIANN